MSLNNDLDSNSLSCMYIDVFGYRSSDEVTVLDVDLTIVKVRGDDVLRRAGLEIRMRLFK